MASGTQVDLDWAGTDSGADRAQSNAGGAPSAASSGAAAAHYLTDEEILGVDLPSSAAADYAEHASQDQGQQSVARLFRGGEVPPGGEGRSEAVAESPEPKTPGSKDPGYSNPTTNAMPEWMQAVAADPRHGGEAQELWREHQEFRAAFASPEEAHAIKELLPGGVRDVLSLREATQSVERIDAALFSGDARAQSEVVAELARVNPAAFRSLFAEAARVLAGLGAGGKEPGSFDGSVANGLADGPTFRQTREGWGTQQDVVIPNEGRNLSSGFPSGARSPQRDSSGKSSPRNDSVVETGERATGHESRITSHDSLNFDPTAYAAFERATNDAVARDVRGSISDTLARVLPEGVADGAARRIGDDIFQEIHRAMASDRALSEQVAALLRERRFGSAEQQHLASLLAGRARQLVPSVARRVIGEWTSSVLNTSRSKAARQAAAASRVDIAAPGGSLDSMPLRPHAAGSPRGVDYASMSDEQILGI
jgi:hypothetical protein